MKTVKYTCFEAEGSRQVVSEFGKRREEPCYSCRKQGGEWDGGRNEDCRGSGGWEKII